MSSRNEETRRADYFDAVHSQENVLIGPHKIGRNQMTSTGTAAPAIGDIVPDFTLPSLDGVDVKLSYYRGKRLAVFMWASW